MVMSRSNKENHFNPVSFSINGNGLEQVKSFKYLGTCITDDERTEEEVCIRIGRTKTQLLKIRSLLLNSKFNMNI